jgi:hypothetical protein
MNPGDFKVVETLREVGVVADIGEKGTKAIIYP